jgi:lipoprotein signal peptidase
LRRADRELAQARSASPRATSEGRAVRSPRAVALFLLLAAAGVAADLLSKHLVFSRLLNNLDADSRRRVEQLANPQSGAKLSGRDALKYLRLQHRLCPGVKLTLSVNPGVVFGLPMPAVAVNVATALTVVLVVGYFAASPSSAWIIHAALGLILAGALGNWYDRLFSRVPVPVEGYEPIRNHVRDFIDCSELHYNYVFNLADAFLVIGLLLLIGHWLLLGRRRRGRTPAR